MASPPVSGRFLSQGWVALAALVCGTGVWLVVQLTERASITLEVPIQTAETLDSRIAVNLLRDNVPITFSYPATDAPKMTAENYRVQIAFDDLIKRLTERENFRDEGEVCVTSSMVRAIYDEDTSLETLNITVTDIPEPEVAWEARLRTIPAVIQPAVVGEPAPGYSYTPGRAIIEEAAEIRVMITRTREEELQREGIDILTIETEPLDVSGLKGPVREEKKLVLPPGVSLLPSQSLDTRTVSVVIEEQMGTRELTDVPVRYELLTARDNLRAIVEPETVDIVVEGALSALERLDPSMIVFGMEYVVERAGERREIAIEPRLREPEQAAVYRILEINPRSVTVSIESTAPPEPTATPTPRPTATPRPTPIPTTATPTPTETPEPPPTTTSNDRATT